MDFTIGILSQNLAPQSNFETVGHSHFSKKLQNWGTSDHVAPGGGTPGLPCGRLHEKAACM